MSSDDEPERVIDGISYGSWSAAFWGLVIFGGVALFYWDFANMVQAGFESPGYPINFINNLKVTLMTLEMIGGGGTIIVIGLIIWRYSAAYRDRPSPLRPGRGKYALTVWVIAVLFLMIIAIFMGAGALAKTDEAAQPIEKVNTQRELHMEVVGVQWAWRMKVDGVPHAQSERVVLPAKTLISFDVTSGDVIHSFAIQALGIKKDAIPGTTNHASFMVDNVAPHESGVAGDELTTISAGGEQMQAAVYQINCAELCGKGHSEMVAKMYVVSPSDYRTWVQAQGGTVPASFNASQSGSMDLTAPRTGATGVTANV